MDTGTRIEVDALRNWCVTILRVAGASEAAADVTANCLVDTSQRGLDSHGVVFLGFYLPRLASGTTRGDAEPKVAVDLPALALVDGHDGLGAYVASFAMKLCCDKAENAGAAVVAVKRSSHFGAASCYAELAARRGFVGLAFSNSDPGMAPFGALGPVLGTNPLALAAPAPDDLPLPSLDIATSVVAQGRIIVAQRAGESIPEDWAIGRDGNATGNPDEALAGAVLPMGGHKGFGLAFMIDVLTACLTSALLSPEIPGSADAPFPQNTGHFFVAVKANALRAQPDYEEWLRKLIGFVHGAPRAEWADPFLVPGEREAQTAALRATAIPLTESALDLLRGLGDQFGVEFPA
jgi:LDH2 family malate/lactate/ureidoglycolate dehydrogenase